VNNNYNLNTVVKQDFAVVKQVDGRVKSLESNCNVLVRKFFSLKKFAPALPGSIPVFPSGKTGIAFGLQKQGLLLLDPSLFFLLLLTTNEFLLVFFLLLLTTNEFLLVFFLLLLTTNEFLVVFFLLLLTTNEFLLVFFLFLLTTNEFLLVFFLLLLSTKSKPLPVCRYNVIWLMVQLR
jgi:hypothetical protein